MNPFWQQIYPPIFPRKVSSALAVVRTSGCYKQPSTCVLKWRRALEHLMKDPMARNALRLSCGHLMRYAIERRSRVPRKMSAKTCSLERVATKIRVRASTRSWTFYFGAIWRPKKKRQFECSKEKIQLKRLKPSCIRCR